MVVSFVVRRRRGDRKSNRSDFVVVVADGEEEEEDEEEEEEALQNDPPAREKATLEEKRREGMMWKAQSYCVLLRSQQSTLNGEKKANRPKHISSQNFPLSARAQGIHRARKSSETIRLKVIEREKRMTLGEKEEENDEESQTMAEREAWLRSHGVEIETAEDRRRMNIETTTTGKEEDLKEKKTNKLVCVKIPSEDLNPFEEVVLEVATQKLGDVLPELLKPHFMGGGDIDVNLARQAATKQLGEEFASKSQNLGVSLAKECAMGSTETFALVRPSEKNGRKGVYIYLDEVGLLKGKAKNARASSLAASCGFPGTTFHGDVFVGAVQTEPQPMRSVDFTLKEMDSSASWLKLAPMENAEYAISMKELEKAMAEKGAGGGPGLQRINMGGGGGNDDGSLPSGDGDGYRWEQTEDGEVEISVYVPENTSAKTVSVGFRANSCVVIDKSEGSNSGKTILQIDNLYNKIRPDECTWTIAGGSKKNEVCVSLAKVDAGETWPQLTTTTSSK